MAITTALGARRTVTVPAGTIELRERGSGPALVFVHGVGVNGDLWRHVAPPLAENVRCVVPDWPWGAHAHPLRPTADLSLPGMARIVADVLAALDLDDVTIVANDTGGAVSQALVGLHPERVGALVLTSCDAFEKFPPTPQRYLEWAARSRAAMWLVTLAAQTRFFQRTPLAYGWVTSRPLPGEIARSYTRGLFRDPGIRRDLRRLLLAVDTRFTFEAAERLRTFDKPALVLWADGDKIFPRDHGRRLAELLPQGRFELVADSRTFIPEDQPEALVARLRDFMAARSATALR
jgi:pimeloyl-ACP methyl ester carboxylesterase